MTMHSDNQVTKTEDAAFDTTFKIMGIVTALIVIAGAALWYFYS